MITPGQDAADHVSQLLDIYGSTIVIRTDLGDYNEIATAHYDEALDAIVVTFGDDIYPTPQNRATP